MNNFYLNQEEKFIIYGGGGNCFHLISNLQKNGKHVIGVIDKRANSLGDIMGIPVYTMERIVTLGFEDVVVIISIKNVFAHTEIAEQLLELGFKKLIYKPLPILQGVKDKVWQNISNVYDVLLEQDDFSEKAEVPVSQKNHMRVLQNRLLISQTEAEVICWLPVELIHNYNRENDIFAKLPMVAYYPLIQLYSYLLGLETGLSWKEVQDDYLLYSAEWVYRHQLDFTDELKKSQIDSRVQVFYEMQQNSELDQEFFKRNAVTVIWGNGGNFYLSSSGRNRVAFLIAKGYRYIPVKMSNEDYEKFLAQGQYLQLFDYLRDNDIKNLFATVPHPVLREYPVVANDYNRLFSKQVMLGLIRWMHHKSIAYQMNYKKIDEKKLVCGWDKLRVGVALDDEGMLSRLLSKECINCERMFSSKELEKRNLIYQIDDLMQMEENSHLTELELDKAEDLSQFDVLIFDACYSAYFENICKADLFFVLVWKKDEQSFREWEKKEYIRKKLFSSIWNEEQVSGYQFTKYYKNL